MPEGENLIRPDQIKVIPPTKVRPITDLRVPYWTDLSYIGALYIHPHHPLNPDGHHAIMVNEDHFLPASFSTAINKETAVLSSEPFDDRAIPLRDWYLDYLDKIKNQISNNGLIALFRQVVLRHEATHQDQEVRFELVARQTDIDTPDSLYGAHNTLFRKYVNILMETSTLAEAQATLLGYVAGRSDEISALALLGVRQLAHVFTLFNNDQRDRPFGTRLFNDVKNRRLYLYAADEQTSYAIKDLLAITIILTRNQYLLKDLQSGKVKPKTLLDQVAERFGQALADPDEFIQTVHDREFRVALDLELMRSMEEFKPLVRLAEEVQRTPR